MILRVLFSLIFACLLLAAAGTAQPDPQLFVVPSLDFDPMQGEVPGVLEAGELERIGDADLTRLMLRARREVISRPRARRLRARFPGRDSTEVFAEFGVELEPKFARAGDTRVRQLFNEAMRVFRDVKKLPTGSSLERVPVEVPSAEDVVMTTHLAMSTEASVIENGQSVAALVHVSDLAKYADRWYLDDDTKLEDYDIAGVAPCEYVEHFDDPIVKVAGTVFLIADDKVVTAAHVADSDEIYRNYYVVFGYGRNLDGTVRMEFDDDDVYKPVEPVFWSNEGGRDVAVVQLDRVVVGRDPLDSVWPAEPLTTADTVYGLGHPYGLPLTKTPVGKVLDNVPCSFFTCDIEVSLFDSGAPVFNESTGKVAGVVSKDYANVRTYCGCWADAGYLSSDGREGVVATRIGVVNEGIEYGDYALVFNQLGTSASLTAGAGLSDLTVGFDLAISDGAVDRVPAGEETQVYIDEVCTAAFTPAAGETWYLISRSGRTEVVRCPQDGM